MSNFYVTKQDQFARVKYYRTQSGNFTRDISQAAEFNKKAAEKHVQATINSMNKYLLGRITVQIEEVKEEQ